MKKSKLYSILYNKCPHCHEGDFFSSKNPYDYSMFYKQPDNCPVCHQSYNPENGFYYGAMYVSYAINVAMGVALFVITNLIFNFDTTVFLITYVVSLLLLWTVIYRKSRIIWINLFVKYDKTKSIKKA